MSAMPAGADVRLSPRLETPVRKLLVEEEQHKQVNHILSGRRVGQAAPGRGGSRTLALPSSLSVSERGPNTGRLVEGRPNLAGSGSKFAEHGRKAFEIRQIQVPKFGTASA